MDEGLPGAGGQVESSPNEAALVSAPATSLGRALREADADALAVLVTQNLPLLGPDEAAHTLRNPFVTAEIVDLLANQPHLTSAYAIRRALAGHPRCRETLALRFVSGLYWRDLMVVGRDVLIRPSVRRAADNALLERLPGLAVGERISLAKSASPGVLQRLAHDPTPMVIEAVLDNPRATESLIVQLASSARTVPNVLAQLAAARRWSTSLAVRVALARNAHTPVAIALGLLPGLRKQDLRAVAHDPTLHPAVRQRAQLLFGG